MTKKDILELKRRMKKEGCTFTRLRGCYVDHEKNIVLQFNETFLNLEEEEFFKYMEIAKKALSGTIGNNLLELSFSREEAGTQMQQFLLALRSSGLKGDGLVERLYERIIENYEFAGNYLILLFHDAYDVITKTTDLQKLDESEEVYEYILCAICPVELSKAGLGYRKEENRIAPRIRDWVVCPPENGFLFPAFSDRSSDVNCIGFYTKDVKNPQTDFMQHGLCCEPKRTAAEEKKTFHSILTDVISTETQADPQELLLDIQQELSDLVDEHKNVFENEPVVLTADAIRDVLSEKGLPEEAIAKVEDICQKEFGNAPPLAENLIDEKALIAHAQAKKEATMRQEIAGLKQKLEPTPASEKEIILQVSPEKLPEIKTEVLDGKKCIVIPLDADEYPVINGKRPEDAPF